MKSVTLKEPISVEKLGVSMVEMRVESSGNELAAVMVNGGVALMADTKDVELAARTAKDSVEMLERNWEMYLAV